MRPESVAEEGEGEDIESSANQDENQGPYLRKYIVTIAQKIPGYGMGKKSGSGSGMNNPGHIS
jgi:hypothetical protein